MGYRLLFAMAVWGVLSGRAYGSLGLTLEKQTVIPELVGNVRQVALIDLDRDGNPELLACDSTSGLFYSPEDDSIIFRFALLPFATNTNLLVADVNRDSIADLVIGQYFDYLARPPDTVCRVDLFDGASNFAQHDSAYFTVLRLTQQPLKPPIGSISLSASDINSDGFDELRVSYHKYIINRFYNGTLRLTTTGETAIYQHFTDSVLSTESACAGDYLPLDNLAGVELFATSRYQTVLSMDTASGTFSSTTNAQVDIVNGAGIVRSTVKEPLIVPCHGDSTVMMSICRVVEAGNIDLSDSSATELLIEYTGEFRCFTDGSATFDSSAHRYELYRLVLPDSLMFMRYLPELEGFASICYTDAFPGNLFAMAGDVVYRIETVSGVIEQVGQVPDADTVFWNRATYIDGASSLIGVKGRVVSWYRLDQVTDIENEPSTLPDEFKIGTAYPNPFNATLSIPLMTPRSGLLTVAIVNTLGQQVCNMTITAGAPGMQTITWDATAFSSGVYFIRISFDGQTRTTRAVLLK